MRQDVEGCFPMFSAVLRKTDRLAATVLPSTRLDDPEANALLDRNFPITGVEGETTSERLSAILRMYRLSSDHEACGARAWWALQHAAFVVKQDLLSMATYAKALEMENQRLQEQLRVRERQLQPKKS